jgi:hypothetical protein
MTVDQIPFYVVTCDKTAWILKSFAYLTNKFWLRQYDILGFKECPDLPENFSFISLAQKQESVQLWTRYLYNYLKGESSEFVFFGLDDYLFIDYFRKEIFKRAFDIMQNDKNIVRYEMGWGASRKKELILIDEDSCLQLWKYGQQAQYRISCQISLWRIEYLLKFLNNDWTPWQFEILGSRQSNNDGKDIICTTGSYSLRWIEESALSNRHPGMVNVLGLSHSLTNGLVANEFIQRDKIQYGMSKGDNPKKFDIKLVGKKYNRFYEYPSVI